MYDEYEIKDRPMLVLNRKDQECIIIAPDIKITIVKVEWGRVRIGIDAPKDQWIYRQELHPRSYDEYIAQQLNTTCSQPKCSRCRQLIQTTTIPTITPTRSTKDAGPTEE